MSASGQKAVIHPITAEDVPQVADFLHKHMNDKFSPQEWQQGLNASWYYGAPNHGFMLCTGQDVVGAICALYSEQEVDGESKIFCNPHTWCVLEPYRNNSVSLVLSVIRQENMHYSMYSPNSEGEEIFSYLGFKPLSREMCVLLNIPGPRLSSSIAVSSDLENSIGRLSPRDRQSVEDHRGFPWLHFVFYGCDGNDGFLIFKKEKFKKLPCAYLLYVSNKSVFGPCWGAIRTMLFLRHGMFTTKTERRLLNSDLPLSFSIAAASAKFYLSDTLSADAFDYTYSELVAMDL